MELEARSMHESTSASKIASDEIAPLLWFDLGLGQICSGYEILLTVSFGLHRFRVFSGTVDFGLKQAELHVEVFDGSIPLASRWPENPLQQDIVVKRTQAQERAVTRKDGTHAYAGSGEKGLAAKIATDHEDGQEQRQSTKDEIDLLVRGITSAGSPTRVLWRFRALPLQDHLEGELVEQVIGRLVIAEKALRARIDARCEIMNRFVQIVDSEGILVGLAAKSKLAVLRALVRKAILNRIKDCLGSVHLEAVSDG